MRRLRRRERWVEERPRVGLIFAITVTGITVNTLITSPLPEILDGLGASTGYAGLVIGAATLPGVILAPVIGVLADRYGRREVLLPCLVVFAVSGGLGAAASSVWMLIGLRVLQGAGSAGLINLAVVIIGDHWEGLERARMIGRNAAVLTTSLAVLPTVGGALTDFGSWRLPFAIYPLALITAVLVWRGLPAGTRSGVRVADQLRATLPLLRTRAVVKILILATVTFALIFGLLLTVLPSYLEAAFDVRPAVRGVFLGLPALSNTTMSLSLGRLRRRASRTLLLSVAAGLFTVGLLTVALAPSLAWVAGGIVVFGLGEGLTIPNLQDGAISAASQASRGTVVAVFVSASRLGQTLGPVMAGASLATAGPRAAFAGGALLALGTLPLIRAGGLDDEIEEEATGST